jgi:hypothetical protein
MDKKLKHRNISNKNTNDYISMIDDIIFFIFFSYINNVNGIDLALREIT